MCVCVGGGEALWCKNKSETEKRQQCKGGEGRKIVGPLGLISFSKGRVHEGTMTPGTPSKSVNDLLVRFLNKVLFNAFTF